MSFTPAHRHDSKRVDEMRKRLRNIYAVRRVIEIAWLPHRQGTHAGVGGLFGMLVDGAGDGVAPAIGPGLGDGTC